MALTGEATASAAVAAPGQRKDMSSPMAKDYNPAAVESEWNDWWEQRGFFTADPAKSKASSGGNKFIMVIPPPNVTGSLHLGHALTTAIEDALTRWHRMCGHAVLWVPGTDHGGIMTQSVVESQLLKKEKLTRHDLGREKFLERVWAWKEKYGDRISSQQRRIAASVDWTRERFTMDKMLGRAVEEAFIRFHEQGLIRRDNRLVNWCPQLRTAISDLEVEYIDIEGRTFLTVPDHVEPVEVGVLCEFRYLLKDSPEESLTVATTRLETMLGDSAVAVHPQDERYRSFVGRELLHPFFPDRKVVIIADDMVERDFGTGCVKITPAHDPNDFKCGARHALMNINIFTDSGAISQLGCEFDGLPRFTARVEVEKALKERGLWVGKKPHAMRLGICGRSKGIIEPLLKPQWWMNCKELASKSVAAVRHGELKIVPEFHAQTWYNWLENIQEWCISRQLWWGHRIPAYRVVEPAQAEEAWFTGRSAEEAVAKAEAALGVTGVRLEQDEDVLDTWFSAGLFPFSVFGWPDIHDNEDFDAFFPTSLLETGMDILFFWVARMVMMSIGLTGKLPFHTVYLHAMVRDAHGRKMSKHLGNVIDPLEVIEGATLEELHQRLHQGNLPEKEIAQATEGQKKMFPEGIPVCGADALRFGLLAYTLQGRNINLNINRVVSYRHFCNKIWNAAAFGLKYFGEDYTFSGHMQLGRPVAWEDKWILSRLSACAEKVNAAFEKYDFADVTTATHAFFLHEFCDVYLELLKPRFYGESQGPEVLQDRSSARDVLYICLDWALRLMHPLMPFITEELYQRLPPSATKSESICIAPYPTLEAAWLCEGIEKEMEVVSEIAGKLRSQKASLGLSPGSRPAAFLRHSDPILRRSLAGLSTRLARMGQIGRVDVLEEGADAPAGTLQNVVNENCLTYMEVKGLDLSQELAKLGKKVVAAEKSICSYQGKMAAPGYEERVPASVQEMNNQKLAAARAELEEFRRAIDNIKEATAI